MTLGKKLICVIAILLIQWNSIIKYLHSCCEDDADEGVSDGSRIRDQELDVSLRRRLRLQMISRLVTTVLLMRLCCTSLCLEKIIERGKQILTYNSQFTCMHTLSCCHEKSHDSFSLLISCYLTNDKFLFL